MADLLRSGETDANISRIERKRYRRMIEILEATADVLQKRGYHDTSLDEIAEQLDLTKATLYHYFESREALLTACLEYVADNVNSAMTKMLSENAGRSATDRMRLLIEEQVRILLVDHPPLTELFTQRIDWPEPYRNRIKKMRDRHDQFFRDLIADGVRCGEFDCPDPVIARHNLHGAINYVAIWCRQDPQRRLGDTPARLSESLLHLLIST